MVKKYRKDDGISYALGATLVMELLNKRPTEAQAVYVSPRSDITAVTQKAAELGVPIIESEKAFNILSPKENCYAIGVFKKFDANISNERAHIVLVNPSNSGNLGTIMRAAAAFDCADLVIIRPAADAFDPKTVRASMGAVFDIAFAEFDSFESYEHSFPDRRIVPFMLDGAPFNGVGFERGERVSLVFGNEATGLPADFKKYGGVRIEQSEKVDSLNLSVAAAIALYKLYVSTK